LEERLARRATYLFDQFRRIALVMLLQDLEDTTRMLQGWVLFGARPDQLADLGTERFRFSFARNAAGFVTGFSRRLGLVAPFLGVVLSLSRVKAGEQAVQLFGVLEVLRNQRVGVGVVDQVVTKETLAHAEALLALVPHLQFCC